MAKKNHKPAEKGKKHAGEFRRRAPLLIAGLTLGLIVYRWGAGAWAGNALPMPFGTGAAVVLSGSMSPSLEINDLVIVREKDDYEAGDIVVYQSEGELIAHRIVSINGNQITTQGDANKVSDAPIDTSAIKGAVRARIPFLGAVIQVLKIPAVGILLLLGAVVMMIRSSQAEKRAEEDHQDAMKEEIRRLRAELDIKEQVDADGRQGDSSENQSGR